MKKAVLIVLAFVCSVVYAADEPLSSYKGLRVPPMPADHKDVGGYLVSSKYVVSEIWFGDKKMWWLKKIIGRDENGRANFEVVTVIDRPEIPKDYFFVKGNCKKDGIIVSEIIAAARYDENAEEFTDIYSAWYVDIEKERFQRYPKEGITCINESYGL